MALKAVFFDLDGTLLDTAKDLCSALDNTMAEDGLDILPFEQTRPIVSNGSFALIQKGYGLNEGDPKVAPLRQRLLDHYLNNLAEHTRPFDGITALIAKLAEHDIKWGIATNKPWTYTEPLMRYFDFASEPVCQICPDHVNNRKPHPESLYIACETASCSPQEALYIGDHLRDIQCGQNAGMDTIAANYGYIDRQENTADWKANHYVDNAENIWPILRRYL